MEVRARCRRRLAAVAAAAGLIAFLANAPQAAALGFTGLAAAPANTAAAAHSDFHIHIGFTAATDQVKDLTIHLPPGLVGDPTVTPLCTPTQLNSDSCPAASRVGDVTTDVTVHDVGVIPLTVDGTLYNLVPKTGEPARFGIVLRPPTSDLLPLLPKIVMQSGVALRQSDFGLDTILKDIPNSSGGLPLDVDSMDITLLGQAGSPPAPFMRNPTSCSPATTGFSATSYAHPTTTAEGQTSFTPTDCGALPFAPVLSGSIGARGRTRPLTHPPLTTVVTQADGEAGLETAQVAVPKRIDTIAVTPSNTCLEADFEAGTCPAASIMGRARASSPLLTEPLAGPVALVNEPPFLPRLGVDLRGQLAMRLEGDFLITGETPGNVFDGLPDLPIARFALRFRGGPGGLFISQRNLCRGRKPRLYGQFDSYSGASETTTVPARVRGCHRRSRGG